MKRKIFGLVLGMMALGLIFSAPLVRADAYLDFQIQPLMIPMPIFLMLVVQTH